VIDSDVIAKAVPMLFADIRNATRENYIHSNIIWRGVHLCGSFDTAYCLDRVGLQ